MSTIKITKRLGSGDVLMKSKTLSSPCVNLIGGPKKYFHEFKDPPTAGVVPESDRLPEIGHCCREHPLRSYIECTCLYVDSPRIAYYRMFVRGNIKEKPR